MTDDRGVRKALARERKRQKSRRGMHVDSRSVFIILREIGKRAAKKKAR